MYKRIAAALATVDKNLLLLLLLPWLLALNNDIWLFDLHGQTDPWFYLGFFLRPEQFLPGHTYYFGTRLAQIVPGYLAFKFLPPLIAQYVLHISFYYLAVVSVYLLLKRTVGSRSALLAAVMMGSYGWFLTAIGSNYVDGFGIAYYCAALYLLILAAQEPRWKIFMLLSGVSYGLAIHCNLFWIALAPPLVLYYLFVNFRYRKNSIIGSSLLCIAGILLATLVLAIISILLNGKFLFFLPSVNAALYFLPITNPWKIAWEHWLPNAFWVVFPLITLISGTALFILSQFKRIPSIRPLNLGLQICFLVSVLIFVGLELRSKPIFQFHHYASYLIPSTFIAIGAQLAQMETVLGRLTLYQFSLIIASIILWALILYHFPTEPPALYNQAISTALFLGALWLILYVASVLIHPHTKEILSSALVTLLLSFGVINMTSVLMNTSPGLILNHLVGVSFPAPGPIFLITNPVNRSQRKDAFSLTVHTQQYLAAVDPKAQLLLWYDIDELLVYRSIACSALRWIPQTENFPSTALKPDPTPEEIKQIKTVLQQNPNVVIMSQKNEVLESAEQSLKQLGFSAQFISAHQMKQGELSLKMTFIKVDSINT
ncbi:MAG: glycosyltransferase family 39 protein [Leptolyngbyaceae cyanobacterium HOT.MB2.61]|nr:glycosyltransferase family 39 protein [Leptolyngbyaceae cyanobacterium HOT.MB2.61]